MLNYPVGDLGTNIVKGLSGQKIIQVLDYNRVANVIRNRINAEVARWSANTTNFVPVEKLAREISEDLETIKSVAMVAGETALGFWVFKGEECHAEDLEHATPDIQERAPSFVDE